LKNIWHSRLWLAFALLSLAFTCEQAQQQASEQKPAGPPRVEIRAKGGKTAVFEVELAITKEQQAIGLMRRKELAEDRGMLFIMPYSNYQLFWMKDTWIQLDMIFIDDHFRIAGIIENAQPESEKTLTINLPSRYVLEINGGLCKKLGIREGDAVKFLGVAAEK